MGECRLPQSAEIGRLAAMPNLFRSRDGKIWKPGEVLRLTLADGSAGEGTWAGSATEERLDWWLGKPGNQLGQTEEIAAIALKAEDNGEMIWGDAPVGSRLFFVLEGAVAGKTYRLAKMVTAATTPAQAAYFRHGRFALFGEFDAQGRVRRMTAPDPIGASPRAQPELF